MIKLQQTLWINFPILTRRQFATQGNKFPTKESTTSYSLQPYSRKHFNFSSNGETLLRSHIDKSSFDDGSGNTPIRSPMELFNYLNEYVVEQYQAKKILSVAVYNHYCRFKHNRYAFPNKDRIILDKSNILLVGPSGSGIRFL